MTTLGSTIGGLAVPLLPPANATDTGADVALTVFAAYLSAFLTAYAGNAWRAVAPSEPIVRKTFTHDPEDYEFSENDLPALYLFRTGSVRPIEQLAEDWRLHYDNIRVFWVLPNTGTDKQRRRTPYIPAVGKLMDAAFDRERDPVFVWPSDTDPTTARQGTVVTRAAGVEWAVGKTWQKKRLAIQMASGEGLRRVYDAVDFKLEIAERIIQGFDDLSSTAQLDLMVGLADGISPMLPFSELLAIGPFSSAFAVGFDGSVTRGSFSSGFSTGFEQ